MKDRILKVLEFAVMAPSGDNCQPWQFVVEDKLVEIFNLPEKDTSLYNYQQRASFIAHGALLENLTIAASFFGLEPEINIFPDNKQPNQTAVIKFSEIDVSKSPLFKYIPERHTNRESFRPVEISDTQRQIFLNTVESFPGVKLRLSETPAEKDNLASIICNNDRMVFENESLHNFLFGQIRWNSQEATKTQDGLDIETLGLNALDKNGFKILKHWSIIKLLNHFGLSRIIGKKAEKTFKSASAIGMITIPGTAPKNYLMGGRVMERIWLEATKAGLSFHPIAGIAFLIQILQGKTISDRLNVKNQKLLRQTINDLKKINLWQNETILMFFRIGSGNRQETRSLRYVLSDTMRP